MSIKIYCPNTKEDGIGGGWTFLRNFKKGMKDKVHFVESWNECDILFITGVTITEKDEVYAAKAAGKKIVLRVDNVPRKSRNKRSSPHERLKEFSELSDIVIYQSEWAKNYCYPLCGDGPVIYNGVDESIFKPDVAKQNKNRYLYAYHGNNEQKNFWEAHLRFQYEFRENSEAEFWFIYDFQRQEQELHDAHYDFWNGEKHLHLGKVDRPEDMADIMQQCAYLIYPAISDAAPNVVLEARACGLQVVFPASRDLAGTQELLEIQDISIERMSDEYFGIFQILIQDLA
jgi:glycosyltransferase involved in cell wall biosynthesis